MRSRNAEQTVNTKAPEKWGVRGALEKRLVLSLKMGSMGKSGGV